MKRITQQRSPLWVLILLLITVGSANAQPGNRTRARIPVTVALVTEMPYPGVPFVILRDAQPIPRDYILLPEDADAALLTEAINGLLLARRHGGDDPAADAVLRIRSQTNAPRSARPLPWAARVINDLQSAPSQTVPRVGEVPAIEIWLPRQQRQP
jgi:hypothetical protein